jgi:type I restriction enzyme S subunit
MPQSYPAYRPTKLPWLPQIPEHWEVVKVKYVCSITDCKHITPNYVNEGFPVVSTGNVKPGQITLNDSRYVTEEIFGKLIEGGRAPKSGDIIYGRNAPPAPHPDRGQQVPDGF